MKASTEPPRPTSRDITLLIILLISGVVTRLIFTAAQGLPRFDPWRHLLLVENLRAGKGFTLFAGQPYLWYPPFWHAFAALMPRALGLAQLSAIFSLLTIPLIYVFARVGARMSRTGAAVAGLFMAVSGPLVAFTSYFGPEALALFLVLGALSLVACADRPPFLIAAGMMLSAGLVLRINMAIIGFLFIPFVIKRMKWAWVSIGGLLPLAYIGVGNHKVLAANPWAFTWDGLATPSSSYSALATVFPQMHPAVQAGLRTLHSVIMRSPEWLIQGGTIRWDTILYMVFGLMAVLLSRRFVWIAAAVLGMVYTVFLDGSHSTFFFRYSLGLFPDLLPGVRGASGPCSGGQVAEVPMVLRGLRRLRPPLGSAALCPSAHARSRPHGAPGRSPHGKLLYGEQRLLSSGMPHGPVSGQAVHRYARAP